MLKDILFRIWGVLFILFVPYMSQAQLERVWVFGTNAGISFAGANPIALTTGIEGFGEANASVCDRDGNILFYTEGSYIWDRNGNLMPNGSNITQLVSVGTLPVTSSSCQGALIVPFPEQGQRYYVFSVTNTEMGINSGKLFYSIVDMSLNGGLGDVVAGSKGILVDSMLTESVTATVGDRCNIWIIARSALAQQFRLREITADGLQLPPVISPFNGNGSGGTVCVSPDRKKLASTTNGSFGLWLYDFDATTGEITNPVSLQPFSPCLGVAFSPDNSKLYASRNSSIYQYDLSQGSSASIASSETVVGAASSFTHLRLAENGKIYFFSLGSWLGVIQNPDLAGLSCGLMSNSVELLPGTSAHGGLPNVVPSIPRDTIITKQHVMAGCFATEMELNPVNNSSGWDYLWSTGSTEMGLVANSAGTYWVRYRTAPCIYNTDTFVLGFPNGYLPQIQVDTACVGTVNGGAKALVAAGDTVSYSFVWINTQNDTLSTSHHLYPVQSGHYTLFVHTPGCDTALPVFIPEQSYEVSFTADTIICAGEEVLFQNTSDAHFSQFTWHFGDGDSSASAQPPAHLYAASGTYRVVLVGNGSFCSDTFEVVLVADSSFSGYFASQPHSICVGDRIRFTPYADSTVVGFHWNFGDGTEMQTSPEEYIDHAFELPGTMSVKLSTMFRACPEVQFTDSVFVYAFPLVDLGSDTTLCLHGPPLLLSNQAPAPDAPHEFLWSTGDTTGVLKVVHPGKYSLRVRSLPLGCSTTETIEVKKDCYTDIPNAFTPNGDGENDYFFPRQLLSRSIASFHMRVWNRWGQVVFETHKTNGRGWDGTFNGKPQPEGAYVYLIEVEPAGQGMERYEGNVTLLR